MTSPNRNMHRVSTRSCGLGFFVLVAAAVLWVPPQCLYSNAFVIHHAVRTTNKIQLDQQRSCIVGKAGTIASRRMQNVMFYSNLISRKSQTLKHAPQVSKTTLHASAIAIVASKAPVLDMGLVSMMLLALQFAVQPLVTKAFVPKDEIIGSSFVFAQNATQLMFALFWLLCTNPAHRASAASLQFLTDRRWLATALKTAGFPAGLSVLQNFCKLIGYQKLQPITFNALNQTKTLFAAFCCFIFLKQKQSALQMVALGLLLLSALVMESIVKIPMPFARKNKEIQQKVKELNLTSRDYVQDMKMSSSGDLSTSKDGGLLSSTAIAASVCSTAEPIQQKRGLFSSLVAPSSVGVLCVMAASLMSGLGGCITQRFLQSQSVKTSSLLFSAQLALFSLVYLMFGMMCGSSDTKRIRDEGWFTGWTPLTMIPVLTSACGGILVGMVTKHCGVVKKGFALIIGLFFSGIFQNMMAYSSRHAPESHQSNEDTTKVKPVTAEQWIGGVLAGISVWMHAAFPYQASP